jgi:hypothetical protein
VGFEPTIPAFERAKTVPLGYRDRPLFLPLLICPLIFPFFRFSSLIYSLVFYFIYSRVILHEKRKKIGFEGSQAVFVRSYGKV